MFIFTKVPLTLALSVAASEVSSALLSVLEADGSPASFPHPVRENTRIAAQMTDNTLIFLVKAPLFS